MYFPVCKSRGARCCEKRHRAFHFDVLVRYFPFSFHGHLRINYKLRDLDAAAYLCGRIPPASQACRDEEGAFHISQGTFYRWIQLWTEHMPRSIKNAPKTLAVGDLHVDSFGTW